MPRQPRSYCPLRPLRAIGCFLSIVVLTACASAPTSSDGAAAMTTPDGEPVTPAVIWGEAPLPAGFPPPGPIGAIVIKRYPAYRIAEKTSDEKASANRLFRPLFDHIQSRDIAMTAPVEMTYERAAPAQLSAMAFLYREPTMGETGAVEGGVSVRDVPAQTVLSVGVRGGYGEANFIAARRRLEAWLEAHPERFVIDGPPRYLGYNSPFVPGFMKYGEVQIPVRRAARSGAGRKSKRGAA